MCICPCPCLSTWSMPYVLNFDQHSGHKVRPLLGPVYLSLKGYDRNFLSCDWSGTDNTFTFSLWKGFKFHNSCNFCPPGEHLHRGLWRHVSRDHPRASLCFLLYFLWNHTERTAHLHPLQQVLRLLRQAQVPGVHLNQRETPLDAQGPSPSQTGRVLQSLYGRPGGRQEPLSSRQDVLFWHCRGYFKTSLPNHQWGMVWTNRSEMELTIRTGDTKSRLIERMYKGGCGCHPMLGTDTAILSNFLLL